jgi:hypothetical protein
VGENTIMKKHSFNLRGFNKQSFAAPAVEPDVDPGVAPPIPDVDPDEWADPKHPPKHIPEVIPDWQNRRKGYPGMEDDVDTDTDTDLDIDVDTDTDEEWLDPDNPPTVVPKIIPDTQNRLPDDADSIFTEEDSDDYWNTKHSFNLRGFNKQSFAAPAVEPDVDPGVAPPAPDVDPDEWTAPRNPPKDVPEVAPDWQNRRKGYPGMEDDVDTDTDTDLDIDVDTDTDEEWLDPDNPPTVVPKIIPDTQNTWFKRAMGGQDWHPNTNDGVRRTWSRISEGNDPHRNHVTETDFIRRIAPNLAKEGSHHAMRTLHEIGVTPQSYVLMNRMQTLAGQVNAFERAHKRQLESLAEAIAAKKLGLDKGWFKAELVAPQQIPDNPHEHGRQQQQIQRDMGEENLDTFDVSDAIEAQLPIQFLAQGAGLNTMMNFQAIAEGLIDDARVPPNIVNKYHELAKMLSACHFTHDFYGTAQFGGNMASNGISQEEWEDENGEQGYFKIHAKAFTFPLLVYELVAGGIRILGTHKFNNSPVAQNSAHFNAATGAKSVEALAFQAGGALDRKFHEFTDYMKEKIPHASYDLMLKYLWQADPQDTVLFSKALAEGRFDDAARHLRPKRR